MSEYSVSTSVFPLTNQFLSALIAKCVSEKKAKIAAIKASHDKVVFYFVLFVSICLHTVGQLLLKLQ